MKKGIIAASIICLMLSGCGKKDKVEDDFTNVQGTATVADADTNEVGEAEHKVSFTESTVDGFAMTADLVIDTRIPEHVSTKKVKKVKIDDDYLISLSKKLFDGGEYEVLKVKGYSLEETTSAMLDIMDVLEEKSEEHSAVFIPSSYYRFLNDVQTNVGDVSSETSEYSEGQVILSDSFEVEGDGETYVCYQERAFIKGNIDGEPYIIDYTKRDYYPNNAMYQDVEDIMIYPMSGRQYCVGTDDETSEEDNHEDNKLSYKDALVMAESYIGKLGLEDYSIAKTSDMFYDSKSQGVMDLDGKLVSGVLAQGTDGYEKNGYRFAFTPEIEGMKLVYCDGSERTTAEYDFDLVLEHEWLQPVVQIDVDATGIRGICINSIYEEEETLANDSNLISFEKANEIASQMYSESYVEDCMISDIRLEYIMIQYEDEMVMAPAWVYYTLDSKFAVIALDGSVVHFSYNGEMGIRWIR